jgi:hypothetical protein
MKLKLMTIPVLGLGLSMTPAFADLPAGGNAQPAMPGTVNYVEGSVFVDGQAVSPRQVGTIDLAAGQELTTATGKAEVLLTPGVFLRVDDNSAVRLVSPDLLNTRVEIEKGRAGVEVDQIHKQNNLQIVDAGVTTKLAKEGYYEFDANTPEVQVFKGKADVELRDGKAKEVKSNHQAVLQSDLTTLKTASLDDNKAQDGLYNWSRLRSQYLAEANNQIAPYYAGYAPGWYWNPWGWGYTFIGAGPFYSPFGWGFYPMGWGWGGYYGGGWGYYGHPYHGRHLIPRAGSVRNGPVPSGPVRGGSVHSFSAPRPGSMGGFSGGMHSSMGGGGFHGSPHR